MKEYFTKDMLISGLTPELFCTGFYAFKVGIECKDINYLVSGILFTIVWIKMHMMQINREYDRALDEKIASAFVSNKSKEKLRKIDYIIFFILFSAMYLYAATTAPELFTNIKDIIVHTLIIIYCVFLWTIISGTISNAIFHSRKTED